MRRCVVLYNGVDSCNISILADNKLVLNCNGRYNLDRFLHNTSIDDLSVVFKPTVCNSVPENGYRVGSFQQDSSVKVCVVSNEDVNNLIDMSRIYKIPNIRLYNYMDVISSKFSSHGNVIVVCEWSSNLVALFYLESGVILDFKKTNIQKLSTTLSKFRSKYKCRVLEDNNNYDYVSLHASVPNITSIDNDKKSFISHLNYILNNEGINLLESGNALPKNIDFEEKEEESDDLDSLLGVDNGDSDDEVKPSGKKIGFFGRLFGKGRKDQGFDFSSYDEEYEHSLRMENARYMRQGYDKDIQYITTGRNAIAVSKSGPMDFIFYAVLFVLLSCIIFSAVLGAVYKGRVGMLSSNVDFLQSLNNSRKYNVELSKEAPKSPVNKISELLAMQAPSGGTVESVSYTGETYQVNVNIDSEQDMSESVKKSVPSNFVASSVKKSKLDSASNLYTYAITLSCP